MRVAQPFQRFKPFTLIAMLMLSVAAYCQANVVHVDIDASKLGTPISPYIYGQFLEHGGNIVNEGVWAELLEDRKFYYPVTSKPQEESRTGNWASGRRRPPIRHWMPIGGDEFITMDTQAPYSGEHTPLVRLNGTEPHGFEQSGFTVHKGMSYTGHIVLGGSPGAAVKVTLVWGDQPGQQQTVPLHGVQAAYQSLPLSFSSRGDSDDAKLEITGTGTGSYHVGAITLMPANNVEGFRAEVIAALKQLHSGVYRFPGGNFVSAYEWRDAVGDRDKRPSIYDPGWGAVQPNDVGTDEFLTLCRLLGVDPYITVNAGFGDAWSASERVEYTNGAATTPMGRWRAANGHPGAYHVRFWGIGNEPWGDYQMGAMAPEQFALKHVQFAKAMRQVDPSITLVAAGAMPDVMVGANQSKRIGGKFIPDYLTPADWSGYMLSHDLPYIDMLSEHYYASGSEHTDLKLEKKTPWTPPDLIEWERSAATQVRVKYEHYEEYLKRIPALDKKPVPVAIDEWAYTGAPRDGYKVVPAYAWAFHEMFRHSDVFQMANLTFATATISSNGTEAVLNPTGMLFKMYRDHFGVIPVEVGGNSPQPKPAFPAGGDQPAVNPGSPTYPLDVSAALSGDRKTLAIAVLNPSDTEQSIHLDLHGAALASTGKLWRMAPSSIDATVKVGSPAQVQVEEQSLGALPATVTLCPYSVSIYSYPVQ